MDANALRGSLIAQLQAAMWHELALQWLDDGKTASAVDAQRLAAQNALADRTFRGLEG